MWPPPALRFSSEIVKPNSPPIHPFAISYHLTFCHYRHQNKYKYHEDILVVGAGLCPSSLDSNAVMIFVYPLLAELDEFTANDWANAANSISFSDLRVIARHPTQMQFFIIALFCIPSNRKDKMFLTQNEIEALSWIVSCALRKYALSCLQQHLKSASLHCGFLFENHCDL